MPKIDWLWFLAGLAVAIFVLPMVQGMLAGFTAKRAAPATSRKV